MNTRLRYIQLVAVFLTYFVGALPTDQGASTTNSSQNDSSSGPQELGWQSLFWALFSLALLAMSQPSTMDVGLPQSNLLFAARSSPFVCAADSFEILLNVAFELWTGSSISEAGHAVNWRRLRARLGHGVEELEATPIEKAPIASLVLFLGGLTQAVKILACSGIPWAKFAVTSYICSYVVIASLSLATYKVRLDRPPVDGRDQPYITQDIDNPFTGLAAFSIGTMIFLHFLLSCFATFHIIHHNEKPIRHSELAQIISRTLWNLMALYRIMLLGYLGIMGFCFTVLAIAEIFKTFWRLNGQKLYQAWVQAVTMGVLLCTVNYFPWIRYRPYVDEHSPFAPYIDYLFQGGSLLVVGWFGILGLFMVGRALFMKGRVESPESQVLLVGFAMMNLILASLYYAYVYDSKGTIKPAWTEKLG